MSYKYKIDFFLGVTAINERTLCRYKKCIIIGILLESYDNNEDSKAKSEFDLVRLSLMDLSIYEINQISKIIDAFNNSYQSIPVGLNHHKINSGCYRKISKCTFKNFTAKIVNKFSKQISNFTPLSTQDQVKLLKHAAILIFIGQFTVIYVLVIYFILEVYNYMDKQHFYLDF